MRCPYCLSEKSTVSDSRADAREGGIRRRRECAECGRRFTTMEKVIGLGVKVEKSDGKIEDFRREKLFHGIEKACRKRPVDKEKIWKMVEDIEKKAKRSGGKVESKSIGEDVMRRLKRMDKVAYMRFVSVYRSFEDIDSFEEEIRKLKKRG